VLKGVPRCPEQIESIAFSVSESLAPSHQPSVIAIMDQLPRTPTGKIQRAMIHQSLLERGGPCELSGLESGVTILDTRDSGNNGFKYLTPELGTVRDVFLTKRRHDTSETADSLGIMRNQSSRSLLALQVTLQVYFLHVLAINLSHLEMLGGGFLRLQPSVQQALKLFHAHDTSWHMPVFSALAAYHDSTSFSRHNFNTRDALMVIVTIALHSYYVLLPETGSSMFCFTSTTSTMSCFREHPARWLLSCMLVSRLIVNIGHKVRASPLRQSLLAYPCAVLWITFRTWASLMLANNMGSKGRDLALLLTLTNLGNKAHLDAKQMSCITTYVLSFFWLPRIVEYLGNKCPSTHKQQMFFGLFFWVSFVSWTIVDSTVLVKFPSEGILFGCTQEHQFCVHTFALWKFPCVFVRLFLLVAALAFMPLTAVPEVAYRSLFGALLAMPLTFTPWVNCLLSSPHVLQNAATQLFTLVSLFAIYFSVIAPATQWVAAYPTRLVELWVPSRPVEAKP